MVVTKTDPSLTQVQHCKDELVLQQCANSIALMARRLSRDSKVRWGGVEDVLQAGSTACIDVER